MAIPHERSPFLGMKRCPHGLPESIQCGVGHLQNMELVHDDGNPGQGLPDGILIGSPHVDGHTPDSSFVGKFRKIPAHGRLVPVGEHFNHVAGRDVGENRPRPTDQVDLVDPQNFRSLEAKGVLKLPPIIVEHLTDRRVADSRLFGQMGEGVAEGSFLQPGFQPDRHGPFGVDIGKGLIKRLPARFTAKAPGIDGESHPFPVDGEVADPVLPATEADQSIGTAMDAAFGRRNGLSLDVIVPVGVLDLEDSVGGKIQDVRFPSLVLCKSDLLPVLQWGSHQLPDRLEQADDGFVVVRQLPFKFLDLSGHFFVGGKHFSQFYEGPDHKDTHFDGQR